MNNHISKHFDLKISVYKWVAAETSQWQKETLIWWPQTAFFERNCAEAKRFCDELGKAMAYAEKLSTMTDEELFKLAADNADGCPFSCAGRTGKETANDNNKGL